MRYYPQEDYELLSFEASSRKGKKYAAVLQNKKTGREVRVHFGAKGYAQYEDRALGLYSDDDHLDPARRASYRARHSQDINMPFSASWFALNYLW